MNRDELRQVQEPLKQRYREDPGAAMVTLRAAGELGEDVGPGSRGPTPGTTRAASRE